MKLKVEFILRKYLASELTDEKFKEGMQSILNEFEGKNLLHQNIGQLTLRMEKENPNGKGKFEKIWILLDQVNPRIKEDLNRRIQKSANRRSTLARQ